MNRIEAKRALSRNKILLGLLVVAVLAAGCRGSASAPTAIPTIYGGDRFPTPVAAEAPQLTKELYNAIDGQNQDGPVVNPIPVVIDKELSPLTYAYDITAISAPQYNASDCNLDQAIGSVRENICQSFGEMARIWKVDQSKLIDRFYPEFVALSDEQTDQACGAAAAGCSYPKFNRVFVDVDHIDPQLISHEAAHELLFFKQPTCTDLNGGYFTTNQYGYVSVHLPPDQYPNPYANGSFENLSGKMLSYGAPTELFTTISEGLAYMDTHPDASPLELVQNLFYLRESWSIGMQTDPNYKGDVLNVARFIIDASQSNMSLFGPLVEAVPENPAGINGFLTNMSGIYYPGEPASPLNGARSLAELAYSLRPGHINPDSTPLAELQALCK